MAGSLIGALRVSLSAETSQFESGMRRSQQTARRTAGTIKESFGGVTGYVKSSLAGIAAALTVGTLFRAGKEALEYAGHLGELADTLGLTTKDLQTFSYAAGQVGISQDELESGIQKLTISMGKAQVGSQAQVKAFEAIGISIDDLKGKNAGDVFRLIAEKLEGVSDRSKRAAVEVALFGKAGAKLDNLLSGSQGRLSELTDAAQKLGIVLSDQQIQNADRTADKIAALETVLKAKIAGVVSDNAAAIYDFAASLADLAGKVASAVGELAVLAKWINDHGQPIQDFFRSMTPQHGLLEYGTAAYGALRTGRNPVTAVKNIASSQGAGSNANTWAKIMAGNSDVYGKGPAASSVGNFLAPAGPKPKKDHSAEELQRKQLEALRKEYDLTQDGLQQQEDILQAKKDLSSDYIEQTSLQVAILDNQRAQYQADLDYQVAQNKITKGADGITQAQADQKLAMYDIADSLKRQKVVQDETEQRQRDTQELIQNDFDRRRDVLEAQSGIAETAEERRKVELELLELAYQAKRQALQNIIDTSKDEAAIENARRDLINLKATYGADKQNVINQTRGPLEDYLASLPTTAAKANEALQSLEVEGFDGLIDSVLALSEGFGKAKESLLDTLKQFLLGLARLELQRGLGSLFQSSGGIGGLLRGLVGGSGAVGGSTSISIPGVNAGNLPGFATGGSGIFKGIPGIDRNVLSLNGLPIARVSHGEHFNIGNDNSPSRYGHGMTVQNFNFPNSDFDSFRRNQSQAGRLARRNLGLK